MVNIVHVVNQFFAGIGGEEKADSPVALFEGACGAGRGLQAQLGDNGRVIATIYYGDNYFHDHPEEAKSAILRGIESRRPDVVVAGPSFNSGRYGFASVEICEVVSRNLGISCVVGMHSENPAVSVYQDNKNPGVFLFPTTETAAGMTQALSSMAKFACRLAAGAEIQSAEREGYLPRGIRRTEKADRPAVKRAIAMLLDRLEGRPFTTEIPVETWDQTQIAAPLTDLSKMTIGIVTTSGVVPWGNPDGFKIFRNTYWRKYNVGGLKRMEPGQWEAIHGGYNVSFINQNLHYGLPLDTLRELESEGVIGRVYPAYYVVPGNQGSPSVMRRIGEEIAADMRKEGLNGVLLVAT
jgi:glycine reductase